MPRKYETKNTYKRICECCGKEFISKQPTTRFCFDEHYVKCEVCGKEYHITRAMLLDRGPIGTCSRKCAHKKAEKTMLEKYGVDNVSKLESTVEKRKQTNLKRYGVIAPLQNEEIKQKMKDTNLKRYGVDNPFASEEIKRKIEETNLEKYGVRRPLQNKYILEKTSRTNTKRYGGNSPLCSKEVQEKARQTNLKNLGVDWPGLSDKCNEKARQTCLKLYGNEHYTRSEDYQKRVPGLVKKAQKTLIEKYGTKTYSESEDFRLYEEDIKEKRKNTIVDRYGVTNYGKLREFRQKQMTDPSKVDELIEFSNNPIKYIKDNYNKKPTTHELSRDLGVKQGVIHRHIHEFDLYDYVSRYKSSMEQGVIDLLRKYDPDIRIEPNTRQIIPPLEIDIYLPDYKVGIECNHTATHNSTIAYFPNGKIKEYNYHQHKTDLADDVEIFLFHLFSYEWFHNQKVMESMILNLVGKTEEKIYARQCEIKEISNTECQIFLDNNHRQGNTSSKIRLGLYYNNKLVSVMTFSKMRSTIGTGKEDLSDCYELVRFCSKIHTSVVGGASKLFQYFLKTYHPNRVRSFSDRAHTKGNLYKVLGFTEIRRSTPGYVWVDSKTDVAYNRVTCQKRNLKHFLNDETINLNKTEKQIMEEHGYVLVYDSGTITWEYLKY